MQRASLLIWSFCLNGILAVSQDLPSLVLRDFNLNTGGIPITTRASIRYTLADEDREKYLDFLEEYELLKDEFEEKMEDLENAYQGAQGETKINKARELIALVVEYEALFEKLQTPTLKKFRGDFDLQVFVNHFFIEHYDFHKTGQGQLTLTVDEAIEGPLATKRISGNVTGDEKSSGKFRILELEFDEAANFSDSIKGYYLIDAISVKQKVFITHGSTSFTGGFPGITLIAGEIEIIDNRYFGSTVVALGTLVLTVDLQGERSIADTYLYDRERGFYHLFHSSDRVEHKDAYYYYTMDLVDPNLEEIPFHELKIKYFRYYVISLDSERTKSYTGSESFEAKSRIASNTLNDLIGALSLGQLLGIDENVFFQLGLILSTGALFV